MVRPSQLTPVQRLLLAISLPITLVFFYFLFRRSDDEEEEEEADARVVTSRQTTIEVKVPHDSIGAVIGVQGAQIKMIKNTTKARLNFKDKDNEFGKDRILVIQGTQEGAQKAELMVRQIIADQPEIVTMIVQVPNYSVGRIIGRNGETIRSISHQSKAKVNVERTELRDPNALVKVELKGTPIAVDVAKMLVLEKIEAEKMSQKKPSGKTEQTTSDSSRMLAKGEDTFVEVYVSAVEHPGHFWVQYLDRNAVNLTKLVYDMTAFYGEFDRPWGEDVEPIVGDLVAAPFSEDNSWYRARILGVVGDNVDVYFVDYGDSLLVSRQAIRKLSDEFKDLPFQAKECCLAGIQPSSGECWCEEAIMAFEDIVYVAKWKVLMSRVITSTVSGLPQLQLIDTNGEKDVDVAEELVRRGLAIRLSENAAFSSRHSIINQSPGYNFDLERGGYQTKLAADEVHSCLADTVQFSRDMDSVACGQDKKLLQNSFDSNISLASLPSSVDQGYFSTDFSRLLSPIVGPYEGICDHLIGNSYYDGEEDVECHQVFGHAVSCCQSSTPDLPAIPSPEEMVNSVESKHLEWLSNGDIVALDIDDNDRTVMTKAWSEPLIIKQQTEFPSKVSEQEVFAIDDGKLKSSETSASLLMLDFPKTSDYIDDAVDAKLTSVGPDLKEVHLQLQPLGEESEVSAKVLSVSEMGRLITEATDDKTGVFIEPDVQEPRLGPGNEVSGNDSMLPAMDVAEPLSFGIPGAEQLCTHKTFAEEEGSYVSLSHLSESYPSLKRIIDDSKFRRGLKLCADDSNVVRTIRGQMQETLVKLANEYPTVKDCLSLANPHLAEEEKPIASVEERGFSCGTFGSDAKTEIVSEARSIVIEPDKHSAADDLSVQSEMQCSKVESFKEVIGGSIVDIPLQFFNSEEIQKNAVTEGERTTNKREISPDINEEHGVKCPRADHKYNQHLVESETSSGISKTEFQIEQESLVDPKRSEVLQETGINFKKPAMVQESNCDTKESRSVEIDSSVDKEEMAKLTEKHAPESANILCNLDDLDLGIYHLHSLYKLGELESGQLKMPLPVACRPEWSTNDYDSLVTYIVGNKQKKEWSKDSCAKPVDRHRKHDRAMERRLKAMEENSVKTTKSDALPPNLASRALRSGLLDLDLLDDVTNQDGDCDDEGFMVVESRRRKRLRSRCSSEREHGAENDETHSVVDCDKSRLEQNNCEIVDLRPVEIETAVELLAPESGQMQVFAGQISEVKEGQPVIDNSLENKSVENVHFSDELSTVHSRTVHLEDKVLFDLEPKLVSEENLFICSQEDDQKNSEVYLGKATKMISGIQEAVDLRIAENSVEIEQESLVTENLAEFESKMIVSDAKKQLQNEEQMFDHENEILEADVSRNDTEISQLPLLNIKGVTETGQQQLLGETILDVEICRTDSVSAVQIAQRIDIEKKPVFEQQISEGEMVPIPTSNKEESTQTHEHRSSENCTLLEVQALHLNSDHYAALCRLSDFETGTLQLPHKLQYHPERDIDASISYTENRSNDDRKQQMQHCEQLKSCELSRTDDHACVDRCSTGLVAETPETRRVGLAPNLAVRAFRSGLLDINLDQHFIDEGVYQDEEDICYALLEPRRHRRLNQRLLEIENQGISMIKNQDDMASSPVHADAPLVKSSGWQENLVTGPLLSNYITEFKEVKLTDVIDGQDCEANTEKMNTEVEQARDVELERVFDDRNEPVRALENLESSVQVQATDVSDVKRERAVFLKQPWLEQEMLVENDPRLLLREKETDVELDASQLKAKQSSITLPVNQEQVEKQIRTSDLTLATGELDENLIRNKYQILHASEPCLLVSILEPVTNDLESESQDKDICQFDCTDSVVVQTELYVKQVENGDPWPEDGLPKVEADDKQPIEAENKQESIASVSVEKIPLTADELVIDTLSYFYPSLLIFHDFEDKLLQEEPDRGHECFELADIDNIGSVDNFSDFKNVDQNYKGLELREAPPVGENLTEGAVIQVLTKAAERDHEMKDKPFVSHEKRKEVDVLKDEHHKIKIDAETRTTKEQEEDDVIETNLGPKALEKNEAKDISTEANVCSGVVDEEYAKEVNELGVMKSIENETALYDQDLTVVQEKPGLGVGFTSECLFEKIPVQESTSLTGGEEQQIIIHSLNNDYRSDTEMPSHHFPALCRMAEYESGTMQPKPCIQGFPAVHVNDINALVTCIEDEHKKVKNLGTNHSRADKHKHSKAHRHSKSPEQATKQLMHIDLPPDLASRAYRAGLLDVEAGCGEETIEVDFSGGNDDDFQLVESRKHRRRRNKNSERKQHSDELNLSPVDREPCGSMSSSEITEQASVSSVTSLHKEMKSMATEEHKALNMLDFFQPELNIIKDYFPALCCLAEFESGLISVRSELSRHCQEWVTSNVEASVSYVEGDCKKSCIDRRAHSKLHDWSKPHIRPKTDVQKALQTGLLDITADFDKELAAVDFVDDDNDRYTFVESRRHRRQHAKHSEEKAVVAADDRSLRKDVTECCGSEEFDNWVSSTGYEPDFCAQEFPNDPEQLKDAEGVYTGGLACDEFEINRIALQPDEAFAIFYQSGSESMPETTEYEQFVHDEEISVCAGELETLLPLPEKRVMHIGEEHIEIAPTDQEHILVGVADEEFIAMKTSLSEAEFEQQMRAFYQQNSAQHGTGECTDYDLEMDFDLNEKIRVNHDNIEFVLIEKPESSPEIENSLDKSSDLVCQVHSDFEDDIGPTKEQEFLSDAAISYDEAYFRISGTESSSCSPQKIAIGVSEIEQGVDHKAGGDVDDDIEFINALTSSKAVVEELNKWTVAPYQLNRSTERVFEQISRSLKKSVIFADDITTLNSESENFEPNANNSVAGDNSGAEKASSVEDLSPSPAERFMDELRPGTNELFREFKPITKERIYGDVYSKDVQFAEGDDAKEVLSKSENFETIIHSTAKEEKTEMEQFSISSALQFEPEIEEVAFNAFTKEYEILESPVVTSWDPEILRTDITSYKEPEINLSAFTSQKEPKRDVPIFANFSESSYLDAKEVEKPCGIAVAAIESAGVIETELFQLRKLAPADECIFQTRSAVDKSCLDLPFTEQHESIVESEMEPSINAESEVKIPAHSGHHLQFLDSEKISAEVVSDTFHAPASCDLAMSEEFAEDPSQESGNRFEQFEVHAASQSSLSVSKVKQLPDALLASNDSDSCPPEDVRSLNIGKSKKKRKKQNKAKLSIDARLNLGDKIIEAVNDKLSQDEDSYSPLRSRQIVNDDEIKEYFSTKTSACDEIWTAPQKTLENSVMEAKGKNIVQDFNDDASVDKENVPQLSSGTKSRKKSNKKASCSFQTTEAEGVCKVQDSFTTCNSVLGAEEENEFTTVDMQGGNIQKLSAVPQEAEFDLLPMLAGSTPELPKDKPKKKKNKSGKAVETSSFVLTDRQIEQNFIEDDVHYIEQQPGFSYVEAGEAHLGVENVFPERHKPGNVHSVEAKVGRESHAVARSGKKSRKMNNKIAQDLENEFALSPSYSRRLPCERETRASVESEVFSECDNLESPPAGTGEVQETRGPNRSPEDKEKSSIRLYEDDLPLAQQESCDIAEVLSDDDDEEEEDQGPVVPSGSAVGNMWMVGGGAVVAVRSSAENKRLRRRRKRTRRRLRDRGLLLPEELLTPGSADSGKLLFGVSASSDRACREMTRTSTAARRRRRQRKAKFSETKSVVIENEHVSVSSENPVQTEARTDFMGENLIKSIATEQKPVLSKHLTKKRHSKEKIKPLGSAAVVKVSGSSSQLKPSDATTPTLTDDHDQAKCFPEKCEQERTVETLSSVTGQFKQGKTFGPEARPDKSGHEQQSISDAAYQISINQTDQRLGAEKSSQKKPVNGKSLETDAEHLGTGKYFERHLQKRNTRKSLAGKGSEIDDKQLEWQSPGHELRNLPEKPPQDPDSKLCPKKQSHQPQKCKREQNTEHGNSKRIPGEVNSPSEAGTKRFGKKNNEDMSKDVETALKTAELSMDTASSFEPVPDTIKMSDNGSDRVHMNMNQERMVEERSAEIGSNTATQKKKKKQRKTCLTELHSDSTHDASMAEFHCREINLNQESLEPETEEGTIDLCKMSSSFAEIASVEAEKKKKKKKKKNGSGIQRPALEAENGLSPNLVGNEFVGVSKETSEMDCLKRHEEFISSHQKTECFDKLVSIPDHPLPGPVDGGRTSLKKKKKKKKAKSTSEDLEIGRNIISEEHGECDVITAENGERRLSNEQFFTSFSATSSHFLAKSKPAETDCAKDSVDVLLPLPFSSAKDEDRQMANDCTETQKSKTSESRKKTCDFNLSVGETGAKAVSQYPETDFPISTRLMARPVTESQRLSAAYHGDAVSTDQSVSYGMNLDRQDPWSGQTDPLSESSSCDHSAGSTVENQDHLLEATLPALDLEMIARDDESLDVEQRDVVKFGKSESFVPPLEMTAEDLQMEDAQKSQASCQRVAVVAVTEVLDLEFMEETEMVTVVEKVVVSGKNSSEAQSNDGVAKMSPFLSSVTANSSADSDGRRFLTGISGGELAGPQADTLDRNLRKETLDFSSVECVPEHGDACANGELKKHPFTVSYDIPHSGTGHSYPMGASSLISPIDSTSRSDGYRQLLDLSVSDLDPDRTKCEDNGLERSHFLASGTGSVSTSTWPSVMYSFERPETGSSMVSLQGSCCVHTWSSDGVVGRARDLLETFETNPESYNDSLDEDLTLKVAEFQSDDVESVTEIGVANPGDKVKHPILLGDKWDSLSNDSLEASSIVGVASQRESSLENVSEDSLMENLETGQQVHRSQNVSGGTMDIGIRSGSSNLPPVTQERTKRKRKLARKMPPPRADSDDDNEADNRL